MFTIICKVCKKKKTYPSWRYRKNKKYCSQQCHGMNNRGKNHFAWKGGKPKCIDCGKQLSSYKAKRCKSCAGKIKIWSEKTKRRISASNIGRKNSEKSIEQMRQKLLGHIPWNKGKSKYKSIFEKKSEWNKRRRLRYHSKTKDQLLKNIVRNRIRAAFKNNSKKTSSMVLLGCTIEKFKHHLEKNFSQGMSWKNYGNHRDQWNIDHIIPISYFDLSKEFEQKKAFNYRNCRPIWAEENMKRNRFLRKWKSMK